MPLNVPIIKELRSDGQQATSVDIVVSPKIHLCLFCNSSLDYAVKTTRAGGKAPGGHAWAYNEAGAHIAAVCEGKCSLCDTVFKLQTYTPGAGLMSRIGTFNHHNCEALFMCTTVCSYKNYFHATTHVKLKMEMAIPITFICLLGSISPSTYSCSHLIQEWMELQYRTSYFPRNIRTLSGCNRLLSRLLVLISSSITTTKGSTTQLLHSNISSGKWSISGVSTNAVIRVSRLPLILFPASRYTVFTLRTTTKVLGIL